MLCPSDFVPVSSLLSPSMFSVATSNNSLPFTPSHFFFPLILSFLLLDLYQYSFLSSTLAWLVFPLSPTPLLLSPPYFYLLISSYPSPNQFYLLSRECSPFIFKSFSVPLHSAPLHPPPLSCYLFFKPYLTATSSLRLSP